MFGRGQKFNTEDRPSALRSEVLKIKYVLPFEWGTFCVSEGADRDYGLVPLTANKLPGKPYELTKKDETASVNITLVSPDELPEEVQTYRGEPGLWSDLAIEGNTINITTGYTRNVSAMRQEILDGISQISGFDEQEMQENLLTEDGVPLPEALEQNVSQFIVHMLAGSLRGPTAIGLRQAIEQETDRHFVRTATKLGGALIAATGAILGLDVVSAEPLSIPNAMVLTGLSAAVVFSMRQHFKVYLDVKRRSSVLNEGLIKGQAGRICADIHEAYCIHHFDRQAESMFSNGPDME